MTAAALDLATPPAEVTTALRRTCVLCSEPVLRTVGATTNRVVLLDPTPRPGGLYELREHGGTVKATRRNMVQVTREIRSHRAIYRGGYETHDCTTGR